MKTSWIAAVALAGVLTPRVVRADDDDEDTAWRESSDDVTHAPPPGRPLAIPAGDPVEAEAAAVAEPPAPPEPPASVQRRPAPPPHSAHRQVVAPEPARYGVGVSAGLSSGVGVSFRFPLGEVDRLMFTVFPAIVRANQYEIAPVPFFSAGARWQHYVSPGDYVKPYAVVGGAVHMVGGERFYSPGIGFGFETGSLSYRGLALWADLTYSADFDEYGLRLLAPLPQAGLIVTF